MGIGALFALLVLGLMAAGFFGWRANKALDKRKPEIVAFTERFSKCFYARDRACLQATTIWSGEVLTETCAGGKSNFFSEHLGRRGIAVPVDKSWSAGSFHPVGGTTRTIISVSMLTAFERDPKTEESFVLVEESHGLRVRQYRVESPRLYETPAAK